jgi:hypothetical protein
MSFAMAEWLGAGGALTTAVTCHNSSSILRRIGGTPLAGFKPYYEPMIGCDIELLHFEIANIPSRYSLKLDYMRAQLRCMPILCPFESAKEHDLSQVPHFLTGTNQPAQPALSQMQ